MTRDIQFFDRPCCGPSAAATLADFLQTRTSGETTVSYHNLNEDGATTVRVPAAVIDHLTQRGALPVMTVDGAVIAAGTMPNLMDALDLASGRCAPAVTPPLELTLTPSTNSSCCS